MHVLETERLVVRHFEMSDGPAMTSVFGDPEVMRFGEVRSAQWVRDWLSQCIDNVSQIPGVSPWAVNEKDRSEAIGYCGLFHYSDICGQSEIEIGYRLARHYWGQGYATEAVCALRDHAFYVLNISRLIAIINPQNTASINVARKAGFCYEKEVMLEGYTHADSIYANVRSEDA